MASFLVLAAVIILALVGVWLKVRNKSVFRVERFTFDDLTQDRAPPADSATVDGKVGQGAPTRTPLSSASGSPHPGPPGSSRSEPAPFAIWRPRPIFITSTFRDMHAERDHLHNVVFPELEERLKACFHHLEPIDLRWGVGTADLPEDHAKELLILKVCLSEIERSRPFIIGLLGDRYGWTPPPERIRAAAQEMGFKTEALNKSVTALEIEFGVLASPDQRHRCHFYLRKPLSYEEMDIETAALYSEAYSSKSEAYSSKEGAEASYIQLEALKTQLKRQMPERVSEYQASWDPQTRQVTGLAAWGRQVLEDLWRDIEEETREYASRPPETWEDQEHLILEQFIEMNSRDFAGRQEILTRLMNLAVSPVATEAIWGAYVVGEVGSGKSSLFASLARLLEREEVLLLDHAVGISPRSVRSDMLLRRWIADLGGFLGVSNPADDSTSPKELKNTFSGFLQQASTHRRVVCLIDNLNQLDSDASSRRTWLPPKWPPNTRLIATTQPEEGMALMEELKGTEAVPLEPMTETEGALMVAAICRRYHKTPNPEIIRALLEKKISEGAASAKSPLWLSMAIEELLLIDADDFAKMDKNFTGSEEEKLHGLLLEVVRSLPAEIDELYNFVLQRAEEVHGVQWAQKLLQLITSLPFGMRESDLQALLPELTGEKWDELRFAAWRRSFRAHIAQRGPNAEWGFIRHGFLKAALLRSFPTRDDDVTFRKVIARHLERLPRNDPLREHLMMCYWLADDRAKAASFYSDPKLNEKELIDATVMLADTQSNEDAFVLDLLGQEGLTKDQQGLLCHRFTFMLFDALLHLQVPLSRALSFLQETQKWQQTLVGKDPGNVSWQRDLAVNYRKMSPLMHRGGDRSGALAYCKNALNISRRLAADDPGNAEFQVDLYDCYILLGDILSTQGDAPGALRAFQKTMALLENLPQTHLDSHERREALADTYSKIAIELQAQGDVTGAMTALESARNLVQGLLETDPDNESWQQYLADVHKNSGVIFGENSDLPGALAAFRDSQSIYRHLAAQDPSDRYYQLSLCMAGYLIGNILARYYGDMNGALEELQEARDRAQRLVDADPGDSQCQAELSTIYRMLGTTLQSLGKGPEAIEAIQQSLAIIRHLSSLDLNDIQFQRELEITLHNLGEVLYMQGDFSQGLLAFQEAAAVAEHLASLAPINAFSWQRDLAFSYGKLAQICKAQGDLTKNRHYQGLYRKIINRLEHSNPRLAAAIEKLLEKQGENIAPVRKREPPRFSEKGDRLCPLCNLASPPWASLCKFCKTPFV